MPKVPLTPKQVAQAARENAVTLSRQQAARALSGGSVPSEKRKEMARLNGLKGGRPKGSGKKNAPPEN